MFISLFLPSVIICRSLKYYWKIWACEVAYYINMYGVRHCIHFCVFDFMQTLAFVSASDIDIYICELFSERVLILSKDTFSLVAIFYCFKVWILKTIIKSVLSKPITITFALLFLVCF